MRILLNYNKVNEIVTLYVAFIDTALLFHQMEWLWTFLDRKEIETLRLAWML